MLKQAASVIIVNKKNDKVLILKRSYIAKNYNGFWNFPGGSVEQDEEPVFAAIREVMEETSLAVEPKKLIKISEHLWPNQNLLIHHYLALNHSGQIFINKESLDFKWICPDKISSIEFLPIPEDLISKIKKTMDSF